MTLYNLGLIMRNDGLLRIYLHTKFGGIWTVVGEIQNKVKFWVVRMRRVCYKRSSQYENWAVYVGSYVVNHDTIPFKRHLHLQNNT